MRRARGAEPATGGKLLFRFDAGVHDISGCQAGGPVRSVCERLDIDTRLEMRRMDHRFWDRGAVFDPPRDPAAHSAALAALHPQDADGLRQVFGAIRLIYDAMYSTGAGRCGIPGAPTTVAARLAFARDWPLAVAWMDRPWAAFLSHFLRTTAARSQVSALTGYITDRPETLTVAQMVPLFGYVFHGGVYPVGGSGRLAEALTAAIRQRGGTVNTGHQVLRIGTDGGKASSLLVADEAGQQTTLPAAAVVLNGDPLMAARHLLPPDALTHGTTRLQSACTAVGVHLGLVGTLDLPPLIHARTAAGRIGIAIPSAVDPSAAPPGHSAVELLTLLPQTEAARWLPDDVTFPPALDRWRRGDAYRDAKAAMGERLIALAAEVIPDLRERIILRADASPATFRRYAWTTGGSIYGIDGRLPAKQPLPGLVLAGSATHGPGVEAVVISGAQAAEALVPGLLADQTRPAAMAAAA